MTDTVAKASRKGTPCASCKTHFRHFSPDDVECFGGLKPSQTYCASVRPGSGGMWNARCERLEIRHFLADFNCFLPFFLHAGRENFCRFGDVVIFPFIPKSKVSVVRFLGCVAWLSRPALLTVGDFTRLPGKAMLAEIQNTQTKRLR